MKVRDIFWFAVIPVGLGLVTIMLIMRLSNDIQLSWVEKPNLNTKIEELQLKIQEVSEAKSALELEYRDLYITNNNVQIKLRDAERELRYRRNRCVELERRVEMLTTRLAELMRNTSLNGEVLEPSVPNE